ncbi:hypothetical protein NE237_004358 [Protea cynaroides]|uniref:Uncharacterized protein n=1 Tax=Protea cynaroides TaxID=273540 RepID=A0A9Q0KJA9_9MAGN|nr:hypothetical protein NE237_004358 [Protea cynaroides]
MESDEIAIDMRKINQLEEQNSALKRQVSEPRFELDLCKELNTIFQDKTQPGTDTSRAEARPLIQKVPRILRENEKNMNNYDPKLVSIGPYHYSNSRLELGHTLKTKLVQQFASYVKFNNKSLQNFFHSKDFRERQSSPSPPSKSGDNLHQISVGNPPLHLLDFLQMKFLESGSSPSKSTADGSNWQSFRSVDELKAVGIKCVTSHSSCVKNIILIQPYKLGIYARLLLPAIIIDDSFKTKWLNMAAYEACPDFLNDGSWIRSSIVLQM